ncbi:MAG: hypothetical protein WCB05_20330, partial [Candidatus Sulfotelmatobacter sp.]
MKLRGKDFSQLAAPATVQAGTRHGLMSSFARGLFFVAAFVLSCAAIAGTAFANPALVIEMPSGAVLYDDHATEPW